MQIIILLVVIICVVIAGWRVFVNSRFAKFVYIVAMFFTLLQYVVCLMQCGTQQLSTWVMTGLIIALIGTLIASTNADHTKLFMKVVNGEVKEQKSFIDSFAESRGYFKDPNRTVPHATRTVKSGPRKTPRERIREFLYEPTVPQEQKVTVETTTEATSKEEVKADQAAETTSKEGVKAEGSTKTAPIEEAKVVEPEQVPRGDFHVSNPVISWLLLVLIPIVCFGFILAL